MSELMKWKLVGGDAFFIGTCCVKISVYLFILQFITGTRRNVRYFIFVLLGLLIVSNFGLVIALLAQCRSLKAFFGLDTKGSCYSRDVVLIVAYVQAGRICFFTTKCDISDDTLAVNAFTDFTCAFLPCFIIRNLQMKRSLKIGFSIIVGLGIL